MGNDGRSPVLSRGVTASPLNWISLVTQPFATPQLRGELSRESNTVSGLDDPLKLF